MPEDLEYIWYGVCSYWTDDWSKLGSYKGMPVCPVCGKPGFQEEAKRWLGAVAEANAENPGYAEFMLSIKEQCIAGTIEMLWRSLQERLK